ncbi:putative MBOAT, membrane-bound O-acyltransferase family protein [Trypoxylus dichotomus]
MIQSARHIKIIMKTKPMKRMQTGAYFIIWIGVVFYAVYNVKTTSDGIFTDYNVDEFATGWKVLGGKKKDVTDFDYEIITYTVHQQFLWLSTFSKRLITCCVNISRFIFWWIVIDFLLHFIYSPYLSYYPVYVDRLDSWTLCGFGYCMGQYFHMKYVVSYGISTTLAKFENIPAPNTPKCIARIHLYSDMWRYFDHGLYVFLRSYIYVPLKKVKFPKWCERTFNHNCRQRLACMLAAPLLALSAISNFYFFAGMDVGNIFFKKMFDGNTQRLCMLLFSLYCCCQISSYIKKREELSYLATKLK